ncbi:MAG TPA: type I glutamate--ammonia ligase [Nitrososphaeraceae archaeon]|jgi:glutamine synthetase|nr:type I glutamate--ammonia ligase [Nitrososphaeraceae archaeon]
MQITKSSHNQQVEHVVNTLSESKIKWVRLNFCDPFGFLQQISVNSQEITEDSFKVGLPRLDGSSIKGFKEIYESDMILKPDPFTFAILPDYFDKDHHNKNYNYESKAARLIVDICEGFNGRRYQRDPRYIAQMAEEAAKKRGFERSYWGPELEFFVFNKMTLLPNPMSTINCSGGSGYSIESAEAPWSHSNGSSGYTIPFKSGYFPAPPADSLTDFRDEVSDTLKEYFGINVEAHHHEVATGGQCEIQVEYDQLVSMADKVLTYKKTVKEAAAKRNMIANFMPKPIALDNGSGMHVSQSLWGKQNKDNAESNNDSFDKNNLANLFYDPADEYAELSQTALYYIGGLMDHARALCALTNPTTNSYRRLVPGYEAPINIAWSKMNRSSSIRVPAHFRNMKNRKRIEYRTPDPSSNIYLVEAALLLAGLDGIVKKIAPPDPVDENIYKLSEEKKREYGITKLPTSLESAIDSLESDNEFLKTVFVSDFLDMYCEIKRDEHTQVISIPSPREFYMYNNV